MLRSRSVLLFLSLALFGASLFTACSPHANEGPGPAILESSDLARIERGELSLTRAVAVRYTSAEWQRIESEIEFLQPQDFLALDHEAPPLLASPVLPKDPERWTEGLIDPGLLDMLITPPHPDLDRHALPDFLEKGSDGTEGSIQPKALTCGTKLRAAGLKCNGSCASGKCRLIGMRLPGSRTAYFTCFCF